MSLLVHKIIWSIQDAPDLLGLWSRKGLLGQSVSTEHSSWRTHRDLQLKNIINDAQALLFPPQVWKNPIQARV